MCTAIFYAPGGLFGRTLDLEHTYAEQVTITPGRYPLRFRRLSTVTDHYAIIGMATVADGYPLYYDGMNEKGLAAAALNFPRSAVYPSPQEGQENLASFELIPYLLGRCATVEEAQGCLARLHLCDEAFGDALPSTPLHWMLADRTRSVVVESTAEGLRVYDNPVGVMTNEPPFPHQLTHLAHYAHLSADEPRGTWQAAVSRGAGAVGLPGDFSSPSRFVRAAFALAHADLPADPLARVNRFFRTLATVEVPRGCVRLPNGKAVVSHYTCGMDLAGGVYYYRTYENPRLCALRLPADNAATTPITFALQKENDVCWQN